MADGESLGARGVDALVVGRAPTGRPEDWPLKGADLGGSMWPGAEELGRTPREATGPTNKVRREGEVGPKEDQCELRLRRSHGEDTRMEQAVQSKEVGDALADEAGQLGAVPYEGENPGELGKRC